MSLGKNPKSSIPWLKVPSAECSIGHSFYYFPDHLMPNLHIAAFDLVSKIRLNDEKNTSKKTQTLKACNHTYTQPARGDDRPDKTPFSPA